MKDYRRPYPLFSLCGLHCGLCPMHLNGYCPGCGGGKGHQPCAFIRCSLTHGQVEYCFQCAAYPCEKLDCAMEYDSFVTHQHMCRDLERMNDIGQAAYQAELDEKRRLLKKLLEDYNDGRRKSLFCTAVTLLELNELHQVMAELEDALPPESSIKEKAAYAAQLFQAAAERRSIRLKLRRKPKGK